MTPPVEKRPNSPMPPAGVVSRIGKAAAGTFQLAFVYAVAHQLAGVVAHPPSQVGFWVMVVWAMWLVPAVLNLGLVRERTWGSGPRMWVIGALLLIAGASRIVAGTVWSPTTAVAVVAIAVTVHAYVGLSHLASAVLGFPGCELRALAYVVARTRGGRATFAPCPGAWTPLDRWEARLRNRR